MQHWVDAQAIFALMQLPVSSSTVIWMSNFPEKTFWIALQSNKMALARLVCRAANSRKDAAAVKRLCR